MPPRNVPRKAHAGSDDSSASPTATNAALPQSPGAGMLYPALSSLTLAILGLAVPANQISVFILHPLSMLGFVWCAVAAIRAMQLPLTSRRATIDLHANLHTTALLSSWIGSTVIYYIKESNGRPHASTWHGTIGYTVVTIFSIYALAGYTLRTSGAKWFRGKTLKQIWAYHKTGGYLILVVGVLGAITVALWSNYMRKSIAWWTAGSEKNFDLAEWSVVSVLVVDILLVAWGVLSLSNK